MPLISVNYRNTLRLATSCLALAATALFAQTTDPAQLDTKSRIYREFVRTQNVPGATFAIVEDGVITRSESMGVAEVETGRAVDADTRFRIGSMTKVFTALAILSLRDKGKLTLDDPIWRHVPEFAAFESPTADSAQITIRDVLTHTAGFVTDDSWADRQLDMSEAEFSRLIADGLPAALVPRTEFEYSNLGYALLGRIVTNASEMRYQIYVLEKLLLPLGMTSSVFEYTEIPEDKRAIGYRWADREWIREPVLGDGEFASIGGLWTTTNDYARFIAFLLSAWPPRDRPEAGPVRRSTIRELAVGHGFPNVLALHAADGEPCNVAMVYGFGMFVASGCGLGRFMQHSGGLPGYGSHIILIPGAQVGLFAFTNRTYTPVWSANFDLATSMEFDERRPRANVVPAALRSAAKSVFAAYQAGRIEVIGRALADNVLLDRSASDRNAELVSLRASYGDCELENIVPTSQLSGHFTFGCSRGNLKGEILLAPTRRPQLQRINFHGTQP